MTRDTISYVSSSSVTCIAMKGTGISENVPREEEKRSRMHSRAVGYLQCLDGFQVLERSVGQRLQVVIVQR